MCGIAGEISFTGATTDEASWQELSQMMARRGPDDSGLWSDRMSCTLAFRRLAILDLSPNGHQPMEDLQGRYVMVFNGEVYNFRELRHDLERRGIVFRSTGDTEVVLQALAFWGHNALSHFNGMFALGFYDIQQKRLLLARDHAGIKPLYYSHTAHGVVFASQYNQILAHRWNNSLGVSPEVLSLFLSLGYIPAPYALFQSTFMLEPGTWLEIDIENHVQSGRFFEFPKYVEPDLRGETAYEAVDAAISAAVKRQMISDVPIGTFLSGGIDSPLVAAKMCSTQIGAVQAFTIGTGGDALDESSDAVRYAKELNVRHTLEHITSADAFDMLDDVISACGEPFADYSIFPTMLVSRLARQHVKVMLSGDGGDELFWGYSGRFSSVLEKSSDFEQPYWLRSARWGAKKTFRLGNGYPNLRFPSIGDWYRAKHACVTNDRLKRLFPTLPPLLPSPLFSYRGWELNHTAQWLRWNEFVGHLTRVLLKVDRASMYCSLEVRVPLLDREVIAVATRVDWRSCLDVQSGIGKIPLRRALQRHTDVQTSRKRGFSIPMGNWLRDKLKPLIQDVLLSRHEIMGLPFNANAACEMFHQHLTGADYAWELWCLLSVVLWEDKYCRHSIPSPK